LRLAVSSRRLLTTAISLTSRNSSAVKIPRSLTGFVTEKEQRREQRRREAAQGELEEHLRRRGERYQDLTGETPSRALLARWRDEYADEQEIVHEAERQQRRDNFDPVY
jgi:hypothetical protein